MKEIIVSTVAPMVEPYVGKVDGIRLEPVTDSPRLKLIGLVGPSRVTLCVYDDPNQALGAFLSCQKAIMSPTINPVMLQFNQPEQVDAKSRTELEGPGKEASKDDV